MHFVESLQLLTNNYTYINSTLKHLETIKITLSISVRIAAGVACCPPGQEDHENNTFEKTNHSGVPRNFFRGRGASSANSVEDRGRRERGSGGGSPLVNGSGGSCNLVQEILFHIVKFS